MAVRHFLTLWDLSRDEIHQVLQRAIEMKHNLDEIRRQEPFKNYVLGMIFEKNSTRTRVSFEAGMAQLGGHAMFLAPRDTQLSRGEPVEDSARVLSSMVDIVMIRTYEHDIVERFAAHSSVPVINGLTDEFHPCQLLADMLTFIELRGSIQGKTVAWVGDGYNMCQSYINAAHQFDFKLNIACPTGYEPRQDLLDDHKDRVTVFRNPKDAVKGAHLVATDVWASMGHEEDHQTRLRRFQGYQVTPQLLDLAAPDVLFMHCLPAHRGEEVSHELLDDPRAVVWQEAENRLHAQKALIEFLLLNSRKA